MSQSSAPQQVADQAEMIVNTLQQTDYQFTEHIDPAAGIYICDCNSFSGFILEGLAPRHYAQIPQEPTKPRPRAFEYFLFFSSPDLAATSGWSRIPHLADAARGDIVAWQITGFQQGENTGHVFIVADTPKLLDSGAYAVRVYDATDTPHFEDTRGNGPGQFPTGAGSGFINFELDDAGSPIAFQFSPGATFVTLPIAIGRIVPFP